MHTNDPRPNWLSEIIEQKCPSSDELVNFVERKARRDAIVTAIQAHPQGHGLANLPGLADAVWAAMGVAHRTENEARHSATQEPGAPAIEASWFLLEMDRSPD